MSSIKFQDILKHYSSRRRAFMLPIPARMIYSLLRISESIGVNLPFSADSMCGLMNVNLYPEHSIFQGMRELR